MLARREQNGIGFASRESGVRGSRAASPAVRAVVHIASSAAAVRASRSATISGIY